MLTVLRIADREPPHRVEVDAPLLLDDLGVAWGGPRFGGETMFGRAVGQPAADDHLPGRGRFRWPSGDGSCRQTGQPPPPGGLRKEDVPPVAESASARGRAENRPNCRVEAVAARHRATSRTFVKFYPKGTPPERVGDVSVVIASDYNADRKDLFTAAGWEGLGKVELRPSDRFVLDQLHAAWRHLEGQLRDLAQRLKEFAAAAPPREAEARAKLRTVPGVGPVTIDVVVSELGDVGRFHSAKAVCAYAGLVPGVRQSSDRRKGPADHQGGLAAVAVGAGGGGVAGGAPGGGVGHDA